MKNKNNGQRNVKQQNAKPVAKSKPFWRQPFTLLLGVLLTLGLVAFGFNFNKKEATNQTETESKTALHYFKNPHDLIQVWDTTVPFPKQFYSETEVTAQQQINEKTEDGIITFSPISAEKEWEKIDFEEITPFTWKWIDLELAKEDGTLSKIKLRRPHWWFKELKADSVGKKVYLDMPEMGIVGYATVKNIRINQLDTRFWNENRKGDYVSRPITGKFEHESNEVYYLHFGDNPEPLGVTGEHPIWSIDRNDWVEAGELKIGEKVKTQEGLTVLKSHTKSDKKQKVYNLEIYKDHNFLVSTDKILVHNTCFKKASKFVLTHSEDVITKGEGYDDIRKLSDEELINSVMNPLDGQGVRVHKRTGRVVNGNTRLYELRRRGIDVDVPFEIYDPRDSDYFPDLD